MRPLNTRGGEMDAMIVPSSILDDPLAWIIAWLIVLILALSFVSFLWLFRVTRVVFLKDITCPETNRKAVVDLIAHVGELGPYRTAMCGFVPYFRVQRG
jgi:hypothetical protein